MTALPVLPAEIEVAPPIESPGERLLAECRESWHVDPVRSRMEARADAAVALTARTGLVLSVDPEDADKVSLTSAGVWIVVAPREGSRKVGDIILNLCRTLALPMNTYGQILHVLADNERAYVEQQRALSKPCTTCDCERVYDEDTDSWEKDCMWRRPDPHEYDQREFLNRRPVRDPEVVMRDEQVRERREAEALSDKLGDEYLQERIAAAHAVEIAVAWFPGYGPDDVQQVDQQYRAVVVEPPSLFTPLWMPPKVTLRRPQ